jgi:pyrroline-5-carboxylate reductase
MYHSLIFSIKEEHRVDFNALVKRAATPNGMNEQAGKEIKEKGAHEAYKFAADHLLERFKRTL